MKTAMAGLLLLTLIGCSSPPSKTLMFGITADELARLELAYYSDYFSFVGRDRFGTVAFALDNNRGRDGDSWQAEHFVVLHDELNGWPALTGNGAYANSAADRTYAHLGKGSQPLQPRYRIGDAGMERPAPGGPRHPRVPVSAGVQPFDAQVRRCLR
jgi:hypothetical protein